MRMPSREWRAARVEAEALRHLARLDPAAVAAVGVAGAAADVPARPGTDPAAALLGQARSEAAALGLPLALAQARRDYRLLLALGGVFAILTGTGLVAAAGLVSGIGRLNVYTVLLVLVGLNGLGLLVWLGSLTFGRVPAAPMLDRIGAGGRIAESWLRRVGSDPVWLAARLALLDARLGPTLQPWAGAALVHAFWLLTLLAAVLALGLRLTVEQVDFIWETTLLARKHFEWLTHGLGWLPARIGFPVPDAEQIALTAGGLGVAPGHPAAVAARRAWAGWLIGCTLVYGAGPRALALGVSLLFTQLRAARRDLPLAHPFWLARLRRLEDGRPQPVPAPPQAAMAATAPPRKQAFPPPPGWVLGLEIDSAGAWPPRLPPGWQVAGNVGMDAGALPAPPAEASPGSLLVVLVSLARAPDRGITRWLGEAVRAWPGPVELALTDAQRALRRLGDAGALELRAADWAAAAGAAGLRRSWWLAEAGELAAPGDGPQ